MFDIMPCAKALPAQGRVESAATKVRRVLWDTVVSVIVESFGILVKIVDLVALICRWLQQGVWQT